MFRWEENYSKLGGRQRLFYRACLPERPRGSLLFVHGYGEHSGRYRTMMEYFAGCDYAVYAPDIRGHGKTARCLGDLESFDAILEDLLAFKNHLRVSCGASGIFLFGHSLGASLVLCLGSRDPAAVQGAVLVSPVVVIPPATPPFLVKAARVAACLFPRLPVMSMGGDSMMGGGKAADPLVYRGRMRARSGAEMLTAMKRTEHYLPQCTLPLLVLHPGGDRINPRRASETAHRLASSPDKTLLVLPGLSHNLLHEPDREAVLDLILLWIEQRNAPAPEQDPRATQSDAASDNEEYA